MAERQKIIISFPPSGSGGTVAAEGFVGGTCLVATQPFENLFKKQEGERVFVGDECRKDDGERVRF